MEKHDSQQDSARLALVAAKSLVLTQAVERLETTEPVKQLGLNRDELLAYSIGVLQIFQYPVETAQVDGGMTVSAPVKIIFDPAEVGGQLDTLMENQRAKTELMRIKDTIDERQKELGIDGKRLAAATDNGEVKMILQHRRDILSVIDTEEQFAHTWAHLLGARHAGIDPGQAQNQSARTPDNAEEHRKKGVSLTQQGRYDEALAEFQVALRLMPNLEKTHLGIGAALQGKGDFDGAIAEYRMVLKQHPDDAGAHNNLGSALQLKGDMKGALSEYRTAIELQPNNAVTHFNLGTALATNGDVKEAIEEYRTAIKLNPDLLQPYFDLAILLRDNGNTREAIQAFREYLRRAPEIPANKPYIEQAQRYLNQIRERQLDRSGRGQ
ncbi:hypothetical protein W02_36200 [Nitrospira sp. KM1]|nr:hypothetical protein W02_36200 [Nitrospira sp. KM1]